MIKCVLESIMGLQHKMKTCRTQPSGWPQNITAVLLAVWHSCTVQRPAGAHTVGLKNHICVKAHKGEEHVTGGAQILFAAEIKADIP